MNHRLLPAMVLLLGFGASGCEIFDDDDDPAPILEAAAQTRLRVLHASPDAPNVDVLADGSAVLTNVAYTDGSGFLSLDAGTYSVAVEGIVPGGNQTVIGPVDLQLDADTETTVVAVDRVATIEPLLISNPETDVTAGSARVEVVHAAPGAPAVDVYVTAPTGDLSGGSIGSFEFKGTLGPVEVSAGDYRIRVTPAGATDPVVYDSGTVALADGADLLVAAVDNTGPGASPIELVLLDGTASTIAPDQATPTALRVKHASPDAPPVDVVVDDDFTSPLLEALAFTGFSDYVEVPGGDYNVKVTPFDNAGVIVIDEDLTLEAGLEYTVFAVDVLASIEALVLQDDRRPIATEGRVRILHGAPNAPDVDIYVTEPAADFTAQAPTFPAVPFRADTGYVAVAPGDYDVVVTVAGTTDVAIGPAPLSVAGGDVTTIVARDAEGGGAPFGLVVIDDLAVVND